MESARIFILGNIRAKNNEIISTLKKRYEVVIVPSGKQALAAAAELKPHLIVLDAISLRTPGERVCALLREHLPKTLILHLHPGPKDDAQSSADLLLFAPVSTRKVLESINRLLKSTHEEIIDCGPFSLNVQQRLLYAHGQETTLTPKLALLLEIFLRAPRQVLDRRTLMERVWLTDYMGDTRTLDVHIRWLREILETDARKPHFLKTVRGVGYCLDVTEPEEMLAVEMAL
jgi:DNA-binding response OmpR family regulator